MNQHITTTSARDIYIKLNLRDPLKLKAPGTRNRQIFDAVRVERKTLRAVAEEFKLSAPRIHVIVRQVERWLGQTVGRGNTGDWMQRKGVAEYLHRERLHHLYGKALETFEQSRQDVQTRKLVQIDGKPERRELIVKNVSGNVRYLELAMKAEDMRMAFDYESGSIQPPEEDEQTNEEVVSEAAKYLSRVYFDTPPSERELLSGARLPAELPRESTDVVAEPNDELPSDCADAPNTTAEEEVASEPASEAEPEIVPTKPHRPTVSKPTQSATSHSAVPEDYQFTWAERQHAELLAREHQRRKAVLLSEGMPRQSYRPSPIYLPDGQMIVPPANCVTSRQRQEYLNEYLQRKREKLAH